MIVHDATFTIEAHTAVWPGDPAPRWKVLASVENGDAATTRAISMSLHTGTHVDAPAHVLPQGHSVAQLSLTTLVGAATLIEVPFEHSKITREFLQTCAIAPGDRLLFKTRNSRLWQEKGLHFTPDYVAFTPDAAAYLVEQGVILVGIDGFSVDPYAKKNLPAHHQLLQNNVVIIELMNLIHIPAGHYLLITAPLKLTPADGAPARVYLLENIP